jgi:hypothetical protein
MEKHQPDDRKKRFVILAQRGRAKWLSYALIMGSGWS